jgi:hypothetical protein
MNRRDALRLGVGSLVMSAAVSATAQTKVDARAAPQMKMTTDIPPARIALYDNGTRAK